MTFSVEGLDEWFAFHHRPFSHDMGHTGRMSFTYSQPEPTTFQLPDNLSIGFHMGAGTDSGLFSGNYHHQNEHQRRIKPNALILRVHAG